MSVGCSVSRWRRAGVGRSADVGDLRPGFWERFRTWRRVRWLRRQVRRLDREVMGHLSRGYVPDGWLVDSLRLLSYGYRDTLVRVYGERIVPDRSGLPPPMVMGYDV